jgi:hypothetical protein
MVKQKIGKEGLSLIREITPYAVNAVMEMRLANPIQPIREIYGIGKANDDKGCNGDLRDLQGNGFRITGHTFTARATHISEESGDQSKNGV